MTDTSTASTGEMPSAGDRATQADTPKATSAPTGSATNNETNPADAQPITSSNPLEIRIWLLAGIGAEILALTACVLWIAYSR